MKKIRILAIAPYEGMAEIITSLSQERDDIEVTVKVGDLQIGLSIAKELSYDNYDVILSRGGTADLIRSELDIPVVDTPLSAYDMLRSIKMAESYSGKFAIAGFQSITNSAHMLCDLLQMDVKIITFETSEQVLPLMQTLKNQNYSLVICDMIGSSTAQNLGLNSILVPSGTESISEALDAAVKLVNASQHVNRERDIFQTALSRGEDDFIILDPRGNLWFSSLAANPMRSQILNMANTFLPAFMKTDGQLFERQFNDCILEISNQHILYEDMLYTLLRIHKKEPLFKEEDQSIAIYNKHEEKKADFNIYYNSANHVGNVHTLIEEYSRTTYPVLITGEVGTGKDKAAALIYEQGPYQNAPYYVIDCSMLNERKWNTLITSENSPLNNIQTTIYMKSAGELSSQQLEKLSVFWEQTKLSKQNRMIFSVILDKQTNPAVLNYLTNQVSCLLLPLPPLRERKTDIPSIATLYINQYNAVLGKQIVGFEPKAMELLQGFSWPHNLDQMNRIIKEMVILTKSSYITAETVRVLLKQELLTNFPISPIGYEPQIDIHQTLDDITYDIIQLTLNEENMNKEKAAKRLGISRSTLWRILKSHE